MRKILYRELKKRLSRLLLADSGDIVFVSEERIKQMIEAHSLEMVYQLEPVQQILVAIVGT